ncbi:hypothetical protein CLAFUW4_04194 [Fulvia fulva]|uniref:SprT-like domain-containing protein n=1 Tax=Passalora fulva TaxID=5499 RepID=A0A9Q8LEX9_PASFU|nr:uncharacterized protein CLAFUR5_04157 [Fulvia fulva]KAK4626607.1 hypothetical protein CLAFUR4_04180 [Fulvia fulva]KAK4627414.1 hypothetical protein CLAFUR0_04180 [Fulvia fulva]UJO16158.1 hypothetical protein CLAFUR5_04157 [Fulvia fulva]WPV14245.1 hypothetical protein CLAFUW4_04194 [Fulvia fulva]WPV28384.1 hypothetical protein CLAFUW7_04183 [Fulvia fulva]
MTHFYRAEHHSTPSPSELGWQRHSPLAIAELVKNTIEIGTYELPDSALGHWLQHGIEKIGAQDGYGTEAVLEWLREGRLLMSQEYFCGKLDDVEVQWQAGLLQFYDSYGVTNGSGTHVRVWLEPQLDEHLREDSAAAMRSFASTLLHELCHAMLARYSCENGCNEGYCRSHWFVETGPSYHGTAWQAIKSRIETAWAERLGFEMRLF